MSVPLSLGSLASHGMPREVFSCTFPPFPHPALVPSFATLLEYASLRGPYALLDSPIPSLPGALCCHVPRGSVSRPGDDLESLLYRLASLRGSAHATRGNPLVGPPQPISGKSDARAASAFP